MVFIFLNRYSYLISNKYIQSTIYGRVALPYEKAYFALYL